MNGNSTLKYLAVLTAAFIFMQTPAWGFSGNLTYSNGRVTNITDNMITVSGKPYRLDPNPRVLIHTKRNDAFYVTVGKKSDVRNGDPVYIRAAGDKVLEIIVERWKRL